MKLGYSMFKGIVSLRIYLDLKYFCQCLYICFFLHYDVVNKQVFTSQRFGHASDEESSEIIRQLLI